MTQRIIAQRRVTPVTMECSRRSSRTFDQTKRYLCLRRHGTFLIRHALRGYEPGKKSRLRQGGRLHSFSQNICTTCKCFVKKKKQVPCCRRRSRPLGKYVSYLNAHRVSRVIRHALRGAGLDHERREMNEQRETTSAAMRYVILCLTMDSASGRVKDSLLFHKKSRCECFVKKIKSVPCCRRRIGLPSGETSDLNAHRVSSIRLASPRRLCYTPWRCVPDFTVETQARMRKGSLCV